MTASQITVYTSNLCGTCQMVKAYLRLLGREFVEKNVSSDLEGRAELVGMGYYSTPVTRIGRTTLEGFDTGRIDRALAELAE
ncbi:MAG: glutaredoxin family protein [SAR202 cluster bacterium]|nr:glutaredoxin family protein [SAR202 cluster bacterium]